MKGKCQCCGYYTVENEYDICPVCFWERDDNVSPDCAGGANSVCLIEAQEKLQKIRRLRGKMGLKGASAP